MVKKLVYPLAKEVIRLGHGKPPAGTSTYTAPAPYEVREKSGRRQPVATRELVEEVRRRAERPLEPVSRRTLALVDRAQAKLKDRNQRKK